ncbi:MAG: hypothetical protein KGH64_02910 [Candidatus Micrarchaeota archaeon]|nr:hypothetical protein [Candidatus Micrarchaeota archaeon]
MSDGAEWCDLADYQDDFDTCKFVWYSNDGDACARPNNADTVERSLHGYAKGLYSDEERHYNAYDEEK